MLELLLGIKIDRNVDYAIAALLVLAILLVVTRKKIYSVSPANRIFYYMVIGTFITCSVDIFMNIVIFLNIKTSSNMFMILRFLFNFGIIVITYLAYRYVRMYQADKKHVFTAISDKAVYLFLATYIIVSFINFFNGCVSYVDSNGMVVEGPLFKISYIIPFFIYILVFGVLHLYKNDYTKDQRRAIVSQFLLVIISIVIEVKIDAPFLMFAVAISLIAVLQTLATEEKKALEVAKQEALSANKAKGLFLANMSHEIRTPINAILGMDTMILRESNDEKIKSYAMDIKNAGNSLLSIINDILDFSKIESGKMELAEGNYDFASMINDVVNMIRPKANEKKLEFKVDIDDSIPSKYFGDDVRIKQILVNLLTNAVKYTHEGSVTLMVTGENEGEKERLKFSVVDTGIGIKEEDISKLYESFVRIEESKNRNIEGTGLGINIVINMLCLMNSQLDVSSEYGKGSNFSFVLEQKIINDEPIGNISDRMQSLVEEYEYRAKFEMPDCALLVVDDNIMNRNVFRLLLSEMKCRVDEAESGKVALELVQKNKYDVIFMDHMMPEMDGIETFNHMKGMGDYLNAKTPVVVLTANAISGAKEEYLAEGFCDYLKKPVDADKLENLLAGLIPEEKKHVVSVADTAKDIVSVGDELPYIEAIDWAHALMKLGDEKLLRVLVSDFSAMSLNDIKVLNEMFLELQSGKKEAFDAFRIKVHSMKSVAATIGADHIAGIAKYLEYAAKDYEHDTIDRLMPLFYREWSKLKVEIDEAFEFNKTEEKENLKSIDSSELNMFLDALNEAMDESDVDRADAVIEELELYSFPTEQTEILEAIKLHVLNIDADQCQKSISKWKEMIIFSGWSY